MDEKIVLMLTGWKEIKKHLDEIPHRTFVDLTVSYLSVAEAHRATGEPGIDLETVTERKFIEMGIQDTDELFRKALADTEEMFPAYVSRIDNGMCSLTNDRHLFGATAMMYPGELQKVSEMLGSDMYIVPSSIHEVICLRPDIVDPSEIYEYIQYSNSQYLAPKDVLSHSLYFYDAQQYRLTVAYSGNMC